MARRPTPDELDLWRKVVADAEPLTPERRKALDAETPEVPQIMQKAAGKSTKPKDGIAPRHHSRPNGDPALDRIKVPSALAEHDPGKAPGIDRRTSLRIKRGKQQIDGRIDLHGMRQDEAHRALNAFINGAYKRGDRCVLVITGKGSRSGDGEREAGVLRRMTPRWLTDGSNKEKVLAYSPAQPQHGGSGALYVMLRRRRERK
ncbi:Smr/MutS family protein [Nisaea acidiphila]|uniref:Smr/MutS family protein n=1 Tax=Nisaea acidiphila TaxID=1862145 RepID=A0A9J7AYN1_9PROT|nr:Smr/MutS family protein [Nisaea acidiphila]UUX52182.1 Smr/MutS family protein [Nisaea acidiphila]